MYSKKKKKKKVLKFVSMCILFVSLSFFVLTSLSQITFSVRQTGPPLTHLLCLFPLLPSSTVPSPCSVLMLLCPCQDKSRPNTT